MTTTLAGERLHRRTEVELFNALADGTDQAALDEYRRRIRRCVQSLMRRASGPLVVGDVPDMVDEVVARLEERLRPRRGTARGQRYAGVNAQFRRYLYLTAASVYADAVKLRIRLRSLDADDGVPSLHERLFEMPTAGDGVGRREAQAWLERVLPGVPERCRRWLLAVHRDGVGVNELARRHAARRNTIDVALSRCRACVRLAIIDAFLAAGDAAFRRRVEQAATRLPRPHADVFRACWIEGKDADEAAAALGLGRSAARALLLQAKERVWRMLPEDRVW